jgi:hypothetical protein
MREVAMRSVLEVVYAIACALALAAVVLAIVS